jgi:hypothetical protein
MNDMRNTLRCLFVLLLVSCASITYAQFSGGISPSNRQLVNPNGNQTNRLAPNSGNGGYGPLSVTSLCGPDTVQYPLAKATGFRILDFNGGVAFGQYFNAPQQITVHGFTFFSWVDSLTNQTVDIICKIYLAGPDSLPLGAPLGIDTVTIDSNFFGGTLALLQKFAHFTPSVVVNAPYVITIENQTLIDVANVSNDYQVGDGAGEWLGCAFLPPTWLNGYDVAIGPFLFDADNILLPHVSYDITANFSPIPATGCANFQQSLKPDLP